MIWTNTAALIVLGVVLFDDVIAVGRLMLPLGILSAVNEVLKLRAARRRAQSVYRGVRLAVSVVYMALVLLGLAVLITLNSRSWLSLG
ncbi:MAG: hypothetical protein LC130_36125 [Bryobacterales bacterium]|nr:hypothetical protein [Bryobacterales bacterium]